MNEISFEPFDLYNPLHHAAAAEIWTAACGPGLAITPHFLAANTRPSTGVLKVGRLSVQGGRPVGFVLSSAAVTGSQASDGWVDAIAVIPSAQGQGVGSALLAWAESWLSAQTCPRARLGGSLRPFAPGLPVELGQEAFFYKRGYSGHSGFSYEWDVARSLANYPLSPAYPLEGVSLRPAEPGQEGELLGFLEREFPGRWLFEAQEYQREGGRISDYLLLWTPSGVEGFCQATFEDSSRPIERFYPYQLPRPWGQFGPLGVSRASRGKGYGGFLIDAAARYLQSRGIDGCIIDWTALLDLYGKFGFKPYRQYLSIGKNLFSTKDTN